MKQEEGANDYERYAPGKRISIQASGDYVLFRIGREPRAHQLGRATGIYGGKKPGAENTQNEEMNALSEHRHLKETSKDCKVDDGFSCLAVVGGAQSGDKRQERGHERRTVAVANRRRRRLRALPEQLYAGDDAILTEGETANPVVTSGTQPSGALVTLDNCRVLRMVSAIQHY